MSVLGNLEDVYRMDSSCESIKKSMEESLYGGELSWFYNCKKNWIITRWYKKYYKVGQLFVITKWDGYYKAGQLLQGGPTGITKWTSNIIC